jgi:rod shape-determining protein MreD
MFQSNKRSQYSVSPTAQGLGGRNALEAILRPVNPVFVLFTLVCAVMLNLLPWGDWVWSPDWLALVLLFWMAREPRLVGFGIAFTLGLLMDTHNGVVMGEHALGYIVLAFAGEMLSKRLPSFAPSHQTLHIFPIIWLANFLTLLLHTTFGNGGLPEWQGVLVSPILTTALWPVMLWLLLIPQRRPINVDLNRPL